MNVRTLRLVVLSALGVLPAGLVQANAPGDQYTPYLSTDRVVADKFTMVNWDRRFTPLLTLRNVHCPTPGYALPTLKELATLLDNEPTTIYTSTGAPQLLHIDPNAFPGTPAAPFWTSSVTPEGGVFIVDFGSGEISVVPASQLGSKTAHVRCLTR